jgi:hypothetical protein
MQAQIAAAAQDPLVVVLAMLVAGVLASHLLCRKHQLQHASVRIVFLILLTFTLVHAGIVPYQAL